MQGRAKQAYIWTWWCYKIYLLENFTTHFIGIAPENGGHVLKQLLIDEEHALSLFETPVRNEFQIRRNKLRWASAEMLIFCIKELLHT